MRYVFLKNEVLIMLQMLFLLYIKVENSYPKKEYFVKIPCLCLNNSQSASGKIFYNQVLKIISENCTKWEKFMI